MLYLTCTMISSVDLAYYELSRAKDWVSVNYGTSAKTGAPLVYLKLRGSKGSNSLKYGSFLRKMTGPLLFMTYMYYVCFCAVCHVLTEYEELKNNIRNKIETNNNTESGPISSINLQ